jgi:selenide,water dikinase
MFFGNQVQFNGTIDEPHQMLLFDPQTSGGLLIFVPEKSIESFILHAKHLNQPVWEIGTAGQGNGIVVE